MSGFLNKITFPTLTKRQKIIISTVIITIGVVVSTQTFYFLFLKVPILLGLGFLTYFFSLWSLWEGMTKEKAIVLLILPVLYTLAITNFYFLLPVRWLTRIPIAIIFGLSFYILLLSQNVFNVSAIRTIPLYRAATTTSFLFTIITSVLLFHILHALSLPFYWNGVAALFISLFLILPILWSIEMEKISPTIVVFTFTLCLIIAEFAISLSFWPIPTNSLMWSIALSSVLFILLGIALDSLREKLSRKEVYLYSSFGFFVFSVLFLTTSWTG